MNDEKDLKAQSAETEAAPENTDIKPDDATKQDSSAGETNSDQNSAETNRIKAFIKDIVSNRKKLAIAICTVAAAALVTVALVLISNANNHAENKYNKGYYDVSGRTVGEVAALDGMPYDEFLEYFGLPADMPTDTYETAAYNIAPIGVVTTKIRDMTFEEYKENLDLPDWVTEKTPYGEAVGEATLGKMVGENNLKEFKEKYGYGDEVTEDTLWKDVRDDVDRFDMEQRIKNENNQKNN